MTAVSLPAVGVVAALAVPLMLAIGTLVKALRPGVQAMAPWATLPALALAFATPGTGNVTLGWAIFEVRLGVVDPLAQGFLLLTASVWSACGWFARSYASNDPRRASFWGFFLATAAGNLGLIVARDVASFYCFFALMTYAAYGLIVHARTEAAHRAARVYLVMALLGEMVLLTALLLLVGAEINVDLTEVPARAAHSELLGALLFVGFGTKAGAFLLHMWLPLAHPVAPTPASAVLSGAMIKAGVFGWLRFLPVGHLALPTLGWWCVGAGFFAVFYGAAFGVAQRDEKTVLAYSSMSQMGFMTAALGVGLMSPAAAGPAVAAVLLFATHHAWVKAALFLGTGVAHATGSTGMRRLVAFALVLPALSLAGAPLSSGALAKRSLKHVMELAPAGATSLSWLLSLGAVGSTLLMVRFLLQAWPRSGARRFGPPPGLWLPWALLIALQAGLVWTTPLTLEDPKPLLSAKELWAAAWPLLTGVGVAGVAWRLRHAGVAPHPSMPAGDILLPLEFCLVRVQRMSACVSPKWQTAWQASTARASQLLRFAGALQRTGEAAEASLANFATIGLAFLMLLGALLALALA